MAPDQTDTTRRRLLKSIGATSLALGATGVASASVSTTRADEVRAQFEASDAIEEAFDAHAAPVLAELADRGVIRSASAAAFDLSDATLSVSDEGAKIVATKETDAHEVTVEVLPDKSESGASVKPTGDESPFTLRSAAGDDGVSTEDHCYYEYDCTNYPCSSTSNEAVYLKRHCCEYTDGTDCSSWEQDGCCL
ncbi:hypothetical protein [Halorussus lipolyticus]|uniref:hypothetical protein n=1 Tax=Halorussus lipolyticus TaxID=3034024 RepID=UPI0023E8177C|nr:hypothetical protein [Halorussus sp. DT80]